MTENPFQSPMADCSKAGNVGYEPRSSPQQALLHRATIEVVGVFVGVVCAAIEVGMIYLIMSDDMVGTLGYIMAGVVFLAVLLHLSLAFLMVSFAWNSIQTWRQV